MKPDKKAAATILIIDDEEDILLTLKMLLKQHVDQVYTESNPYHLPRLLREYQPDVVLLDMNFRKGDTSGEAGMEWLKKIKALRPATQVVMITAYGETDKVVATLKAGATDFIEKPWRNEKLLATLHAALQLSRSEQEVLQLQTRQKLLNEHIDQLSGEIIGASEAMRQVFQTIDKVAATDAGVLILGENGTGKELVAREIHRRSHRKDEVFIKVDVGAIPESLFESELFGHKKGAFTDAKEDRIGRFEAASGGTLFLDEIGNIPIPMQVKLLSAVQQGEIVPVGANKPVQIDVRLICATNMPLYDMVAEKAFRQDLLYRINTVEIHLPPLRDRTGDIELLSRHFLQELAAKYKKPGLTIQPAAIEKLKNHSWPGNVRELQHAIERAIILTDDATLTPDDFLLQRETPRKTAPTTEETLNLEAAEQEVIRKALRRHNGNVSKAAEELGLSRGALYRRMEKFGM
ncbi:MAG: sigma-54-dependent Fis family transcriptional regulator [Saprospiraceae bacterium]|nr:sigma-54-dependent Fis family transcriptional regulator [Saprospiraceae bacterium]